MADYFLAFATIIESSVSVLEKEVLRNVQTLVLHFAFISFVFIILFSLLYEYFSRQTKVLSIMPSNMEY